MNKQYGDAISITRFFYIERVLIIYLEILTAVGFN